mgnify:CR=1 FL=1
MAELTIDFDLECSRCGEDLEINHDDYYATRQIQPCDCMVYAIKDLENKIKELEAKIKKQEKDV